MKLRLLVILACPESSGKPGDVVEISAALGQALVDGGHAVSVEPAPVAAPAPPTDLIEADETPDAEPEAAAFGEASEQAVAPSARPRRRG